MDDDAGLMPPPAARPPKLRRGNETVLEEEEWVAKMEGIIERDFFPELGKLQDKVAWLEAVRSGNPEAIRGAQIRIAQRRQGVAATPFTIGRTPSTARTPAGAFTPSLDDPAAAAAAAVPNVSLDTFLANHTSEDNASFSDIMERTNKRRRERAATLLDPSTAIAPNLLTDGRQRTDGFGTSGQQPDTLTAPNYKPVNLLMYDGANVNSLALSKREKLAMAQGPPKAINHRATRLLDPARPAAATPSTSIDTAASTQLSGGASGGSIGKAAAGAGAAAGRGGRGAGYDILATPSFEPGVDASPLVTWGDIDATPMRIEVEDLPPGGLAPAAGRGSSFRINEKPRREQKGHELAARAGAAVRRREQRPGGAVTPARAAALAALGRGGKTPRGGGTGGGTTPLSSAGKRLVNSLKKGGGAVMGSGSGNVADSALRASYGHGTPARKGDGWGWESGAATPSHDSSWTPKASR